MIFPFEGRHYKLKNVRLTPRPVQTPPHPPLWIRSRRAEGDRTGGSRPKAACVPRSRSRLNTNCLGRRRPGAWGLVFGDASWIRGMNIEEVLQFDTVESMRSCCVERDQTGKIRKAADPGKSKVGLNDVATERGSLVGRRASQRPVKQQQRGLGSDAPIPSPHGPRRVLDSARTGRPGPGCAGVVDQARLGIGEPERLFGVGRGRSCVAERDHGRAATAEGIWAAGVEPDGRIEVMPGQRRRAETR